MLDTLSIGNCIAPKKLSLLQKHSYGTQDSRNRIIHGDNKEVLKILNKEFYSQIQCIYIDPPYNNGEKYVHYNDSSSHETWISNIKQTLKLLKPLLAANGSIWISIDDNEMHYLKVAADGVFGRESFISTIVWQQRTTRENRSIFSNNHEYILVYAKDPKLFKQSRNLLPLSNEVLKRYKNPDQDIRGPWQSISANVQSGHATVSQFYNLIAPNGTIHYPPKGRCWVFNQSKMNEEIQNNNIWFGKNGNAVPRIKKFLNGSNKGLTPETLWLGNDVGTNKLAKKHLLDLFPNDEVFDTPKPEQLIKRILEIATKKGDLVLDCYLGSGSTISTAHKMERNYIGIEIGNHIIDLASIRMKKVIDGEKGGISETVSWSGGGGYSFLECN